MTNLKLEMTISHNQSNESISVISKPSTMTIELDEAKTKTWNEIGKFNPSILYVWAEKIWEIYHPNIIGKVTNVRILN
jgi:hypothetical protein